MSLYPTLQTRIQAFIRLGLQLSSIEEEEKLTLFRRAENQNAWFNSASLDSALEGLRLILDEKNLTDWLSNYSISDFVKPKNVGVLMAGNIPAVGFHDLLCVLISGNMASVKLSSSDSVLVLWLIDQLIAIEPAFASLVSVEEMLKNKDAYIATGSDNSARYFNYYFGKYPHIIRANRTSVAILRGEETDQDLENLGADIFEYFGLGCRNVSKVFVKSEESLIRLLKVLEKKDWIHAHHKYLNNYDYNKSIYLVNRDSHLDNGFLLVKESQDIVSPIGVLYFEKYEEEIALKQRLASIQDKIQCVVGNRSELISEVIPFGKAQLPGPGDYADHVDTLAFLISLSDS